MTVADGSGQATRSRGRADWLERRRLALSIGVLTGIYAAVIALGDARAWSGSDAGGKVATIRYMAQHHTWVPQVGYWAADVDPTGAYHQLTKTTVLGGHFVQATTYPFIYLGLLLWHVGGFNAILALPVAGSVLAAVAGRRMAKVIGSESGWWAFWAVGLATPVFFYSGDFWEHSMAVGLAVLALALALEPGGWIKAGGAGVAAGTGAVLRNEVLVYVAVAGVVFLLTASLRRRWLASPGRLVALIVGAGLPLAGTRVFDRVVIGTGAGSNAVVGARSSGTLSQAGSALTQRVKDAVLTTFGLFPDESRKYLLVGVVALLALLTWAWLARSQGRGSPVGRAGVVVALGAYAARWVQGLGFVSGMVPAAPLAALGAQEVRRSTEARVVILVAVLAIVPIWAVQWTGELLPQWGGRYLLVSGVLLTVVAGAAIEAVPLRSIAAVGLVALSVGVSVFGAAWHISRTRGVAQTVATLESAPPDVVIVSRLSDLGREAGGFYGRHRWLTAPGGGSLDPIASILRAHEVGRVEVVELNSPPALPLANLAGYTSSGERHVSYLGFDLRVTDLQAG